MLKFLRKLFCRKERRPTVDEMRGVARVYDVYFSGRICPICKEPYVGIAQDCKCTNYGN